MVDNSANRKDYVFCGVIKVVGERRPPCSVRVLKACHLSSTPTATSEWKPFGFLETKDIDCETTVPKLRG